MQTSIRWCLEKSCSKFVCKLIPHKKNTIEFILLIAIIIIIIICWKEKCWEILRGIKNDEGKRRGRTNRQIINNYSTNDKSVTSYVIGAYRRMQPDRMLKENYKVEEETTKRRAVEEISTSSADESETDLSRVLEGNRKGWRKMVETIEMIYHITYLNNAILPEFIISALAKCAR